MTAEAGAVGRRSGGSRPLRILAIVIAGVLVTLALLIALPPVGLIKDQLARDIGAAIGRKVTIEDASIDLLKAPEIHAALMGVAVSNPESMLPGDVFKAEKVQVRIEMLPLVKGRVNILGLDLMKPEFRLEEAADGTRNWVFTSKGGKGEAMRLPPSTRIEGGRLSFTSAKSGAARAFENILAAVTLDGVSGAAGAKGTLDAGGQSVAFNLGVRDAFAAIGGRSSGLTLRLDSRTLTADLDGEALFAAAAEFSGDVNGSTPSLGELAAWLGSGSPAAGDPIKGSIAGKIKATTRDVVFQGANIMLNGTSSVLDGRLDLGGPRPKLEGTLAAERVDLSRVMGASKGRSLLPQAAAATPTEDALEVEPGWTQLLLDLAALENGTTPEAVQDDVRSLAAAPNSPGWSEEPLNFKVVKALDLDLLVTAKEVALGALEMKDGRIKTAITDGVLDAKLESLEVGRGKAQGTIALDARATPPSAALALDMTEVAAEPIITELTGRPLISGTSNVAIVAKAQGQTQSQLASTLEGKARFQMGKGALRGFDVRRMISEWWRKWSFNLAMKTGFEKLEAQYDIKKGIAKSQPGLSLDGSEVEINSVGDVNVAARRLNQEIRIKVVPPPTALPIPVRISGDWSKPTIGVDWNGLFSSAAQELGGPQAVTSATEPAPPEVQAAIRRVLNGSIPQDRLSEDGRAMLRSLLPPEAPQ